MKNAASVFFVLITTAQIWAGPYSGIVIFGDSLSDTGNGVPQATPPYWNGRISNGPVWVERLAERLELPPLASSGSGGMNYARGGATTGDMDVQVANYLRNNTPQPDELFVFWGGVNDYNFGQSDPAAVVSALSRHIRDVASAGAGNILVANIPTYLGSFRYGSAEQHNQVLVESLAEVRRDNEHLSVFEFDYFSFFESVVAEPDAFGFTEMTSPACRDCGFGERASASNIVSNPDEYYFWDSIHPSASAHELIGDAAFAVVVPEPSSLPAAAVGFLCCCVVGRRCPLR